MPFDDTSARADIAGLAELRILDEMARLLATPEGWCKGSLSREGPNGAMSYCLYGALFQADHGNPYAYRNHTEMIHAAGQRVERVLIGLVPAADTAPFAICAFNNADTTTHADILALLARAKEKVLETV